MRDYSMNKNCNFCGNKNFTEKNVEYIYKRDDKYIFINDVPCEECDFCGEQYFKAKVLKTIELEYHKVYNKHKKVKNEIKVPVEKYLEFA